MRKYCGAMLDDNKHEITTTVSELNTSTKYQSIIKKKQGRITVIGYLGILICFLGIILANTNAIFRNPTDTGFVIKLSGTNGIAFNGACTSVFSGKPNSSNIEGKVPYQFQAYGEILSLTFQKQSQTGILKVQIFKKGKIILDCEISDPYGVIAAPSL
jgi:hypothetical protein